MIHVWCDYNRVEVLPDSGYKLFDLPTGLVDRG